MTQNPTKPTNVGETEIEKDKFSFVWTTPDYSAVSSGQAVQSPIVYGGPKSNHGWRLSMYPYEFVNGEQHFSIYIELVKYGKGTTWWEWMWHPVKANVRFSILNEDGEAVYETAKTKLHEFSTSFFCTNRSGCANFISYSRLKDLNLGFNNKLKIRCEVEIMGELKQSVKRGIGECSLPDEERIKRRKFEVLDDLGKLFKESISTDLTILTRTTSFKAHKAILSARSSVFAAMFNCEMIEKKTATVKIIDFEDEVVKGMLEHIYMGKTDCMSVRAPELLQIAEKYELLGLKEDSQHVIADNLDKENVGIILVLADSHNAPYLKNRALDFINLNKIELLKSKTFRDAMKDFDADLVLDLYLCQP